MRILYALMLLASLGGLVLGQDPGATPPFSVAISIENATVKVGSPVRIKIQVTNASNHDLNIGGGVDRETGLRSNYIYDIHDINGNLLPKKVFKHSEAAPAGNEIETAKVILGSLKPGETSSDMAEVSWPYDMSQPGKYTIQLSRYIPGDKKNGVVKSNAITVTVIP